MVLLLRHLRRPVWCSGLSWHGLAWLLFLVSVGGLRDLAQPGLRFVWFVRGGPRHAIIASLGLVRPWMLTATAALASPSSSPDGLLLGLGLACRGLAWLLFRFLSKA